jgi:hypothetical protein
MKRYLSCFVALILLLLTAINAPLLAFAAEEEYEDDIFFSDFSDIAVIFDEELNVNEDIDSEQDIYWDNDNEIIGIEPASWGTVAINPTSA